MKKSILLAVLILAVASISFGQAFIGIAMPETHVQRWVKDGNSLKAEAEKRGYKAEVQWGNADQTTQNQQIQSFLTQGAKVLIIGSINNGILSQVAAAKRDKVEIIAYDRIIQGTGYNYFITFNNYKVGTLQGQAIVKALNLDAATKDNPKYITLFAGSITDDNAFFFFNGAIDVLNPYVDKGVLKVVGPYPRNSRTNREAFARITTENWFANIAKARMEGLLINEAANVTLDAVLSPNDTLARGIIEALKADAKYRGHLPIVTGQDAEFASIMSIKNGEQYMTVFKDTAKLAEAAIILADQIIKNPKAKAADLKVPNAVIASGDLKEIGNTGGKNYVTTFLLDPVSVTKDNIQVPVNAGFYSASEAAQIQGTSAPAAPATPTRR